MDKAYNTLPRQRHRATLCNSPPERFTTSWSINCSIRSGFITSETNWGWVYASRIFWCSKCLTVDWNFGLIFWGLYETLNSGISASDPPSMLSGFNKPAWIITRTRWIDMLKNYSDSLRTKYDQKNTSIRINVVFPVPFSPSITIIWESVNSPSTTRSLKLPWVLVMVGYLYRAYVWASSALSCGVSAT